MKKEVDNIISQAKLIEILDAADLAIDHTGKAFTEDERIDLYIEAIEFVLLRELLIPLEMVREYIDRLVEEKTHPLTNRRIQVKSTYQYIYERAKSKVTRTEKCNITRALLVVLIIMVAVDMF